MRILAFNIAHDSSVCSLNNGEIEFFCKEERLTRVKRDRHPFKSLELYKSLNIGPIDRILYCNPTNKEHDISYTYSKYIEKIFGKELIDYSQLQHHQCHAAIAYFNSGFTESLVFVIDRNGSLFLEGNSNVLARESESVYICTKEQFHPLLKRFHQNQEHGISKDYAFKKIQEHYPNTTIEINDYSIVQTYEAATVLIGQNILENGKTMGLSSYSSNTNFPKITNQDLFYQSNGNVCFSGLENEIINEVTEDNYRFYAHKAKHVQIDTQKKVLTLIKKYVEETGITNVCLVGGYGLNVVANSYYTKNLSNVNFYFEPVSDDTGISIGAAMLEYKRVTGRSPIPALNNFYHFYNKDDYIQGEKATIDKVVDLLLEQKSVAIFEGLPEAGPRALGHRSILFDPRNPNAKDIVNKIKKREWYRPFAGIVLQEYFEEYFETHGIKTSPFMTINFDAKQKTKQYVPGIIHVDGTCRIQTVTEGTIYNLLNKFYKKTNCPMILNTSFNLAGEALVQTKKDAIYTLNNSSLDAVYFVDDGIIVYNKDFKK